MTAAQRRTRAQLIEAGRPRPTIIICVESEVGQSRPLCGKHELPVAQGPPAYEERSHSPPLFEEAARMHILLNFE
ncbi:hypothetical protein DPMN_033123 [Dreissena polymorpha]|uniref:Uncharacterized protein n=1 Tax=Dreissena polymorpha TaxID=45954 RepID=A0A9D4M382_DREPO|nr:hypothetical protein DPMN_033123 [Dreissena polymorpha]